MKKTAFILIVIFLSISTSCNDEKITELNTRIAELETENQKLTDSISGIQYFRVLNSKVFGSANRPTFQAGKENKVTFEFYNTEKIREYNVYQLSADGKREKLIHNGLTENGFEYSFVPRKKGLYKINLLTVFDTGNTQFGEIEIPAHMTLNITE
ncbi:hypothetical protein NYZ99_09230 [Maribacter litopenaei]|uniref:Uncharacterized protein n=1 Tax=Maribacter litopenaei TaxID=2976127 RepID=A0ABY5YE22_9FLAO|nr:hypothetical protein [Maribacter litopenaei]UWX56360.1 hypothetical protein NYZ99_09230 [Maribacter litopenaei]